MLLPRVTITVRDENGVQFTKVSDYGEDYDFNVNYEIEMVENPNYSPEDFEDDDEDSSEASPNGHKDKAEGTKKDFMNAPDFFKFTIAEPSWDSLKEGQRFASKHYPLMPFDKSDRKRLKLYQNNVRRFKQINRLFERKIRFIAFCRRLQSILQ